MVEVLVGYKKFYALFAGLLLSAAFIFGYEISHTAYLWSAWIFIWTSPPILNNILSTFSTHWSPQQLGQSIKKSASKDKLNGTNQTVNNTPYYALHLYGVCQAFSLVNVRGSLYTSSLLSLFFTILGWVLAISGFCGALWSRNELGGEWRGAPEVRDDHKLITSGPYKFVRHPIYTALVTMMLGSALVSGNVLGFAEVGLVFIFYTYKAKMEEAFLLEHFKGQYQQYSLNTDMIIPFII
eukprot:TRINITY_DN16768_c0_g1_i1.p1 TRINITY_DN16768_c0_g1~~TRINITY_DN16768_c0_g1_i1.p1  ORF type:complete len:239 (+),score=49.28 TRINITY_DN16768_c0_g1_i1:149-865(+)